jgi:hypothetical protein
MDADLKRISKPLDTLIKGEMDNTSAETKVYFDDLHLSPLKVKYFILQKIFRFTFWNSHILRKTIENEHFKWLHPHPQVTEVSEYVSITPE